MSKQSELYIVDSRVLPEVFGKVIAVKNLIASDSSMSVQEAVNKVGISRSAFYKYRDYIFPLGEDKRGHTVIFACNLSDKPGLLSNVLDIIASEDVNILTINQAIPIGGIANVTISVEVSRIKNDISVLLDKLRVVDGLLSIKIIARE
jgi:chorismate mutase